MCCSYSVNNIGTEGAPTLVKSLKQNLNLTELNLESMLEPHELLFLAAR